MTIPESSRRRCSSESCRTANYHRFLVLFLAGTLFFSWWGEYRCWELFLNKTSIRMKNSWNHINWFVCFVSFETLYCNVCVQYIDGFPTWMKLLIVWRFVKSLMRAVSTQRLYHWSQIIQLSPTYMNLVAKGPVTKSSKPNSTKICSIFASVQRISTKY